MFTIGIMAKSIYHKLNLIFNQQSPISCPLKVMLIFQLFMSTMLPILAWFSLTGLSRTIDIMMNFAGLIVITEIDNWAGETFELYIEAFHDETLKMEDYLEFKSDNKARVASYYQMIVIATLMLLQLVFNSVEKLRVFCPNIE